MKRFLKSFVFALTGIRAAIRKEQSLRLHLAAMSAAIIAGLYVGLSIEEWGLVIFAIGLVLAAELFNTAIERLGDEASDGKQKQTIKNAKDAAAGAVLLSALTALVIGVLFLIIPLVRKILDLLQN